MKAKVVFFAAVLLSVILSDFAFGQDPNKVEEATAGVTKYSSYEEVKKDVGKLREAGEHKKAIDILEGVKNEFPDNIIDTIVSLSYLYRKTKDYGKAFELYDEAAKKDILLEIDRQIWRNVHDEKYERMQEINKRNNLLRARYQLRAKPKYEVVRPEGYSADKSWPLLMVLHGGNGTIEKAKKYWKSELLGKEYLVGFLQSSFVQTSVGFAWRNSGDRQKEIDHLYKKIVGEYPNVDTKRVYISGFAAGGAMAMNMALRGEAPISGIIAVCPARGRGFEPTEVERGVQRGVKAVIIAGEKDRRTKKLKTKVIPSFEEGGLVFELIVVPGLGHAIGDDFGRQIDSALEFLQQKGANKG